MLTPENSHDFFHAPLVGNSIIRKRMESHEAAKSGLVSHYNAEMERILNENSEKDRYWILGKTRFPPELGGKVGRTFLEASPYKPHLVKDAFLYEVDNRRGVKTILWICYRDGTLRFPTLGKTIRVSA